MRTLLFHFIYLLEQSNLSAPEIQLSQLNQSANTAERSCITRPATGRKVSARISADKGTGRSILNTEEVQHLNHAPVQHAVKAFLIIRVIIENIAHTLAISPTVMERMIKVHSNEITYLITMKLYKKMLDEALITEKEYAEIDTKMQAKYSPKIGVLFCEIPRKSVDFSLV